MRIIFKHLMPNVMPSIIVIATTMVAHAISAEAALSFLGIGLPITEPSLGQVLDQLLPRHSDCLAFTEVPAYVLQKCRVSIANKGRRHEHFVDKRDKSCFTFF